MESPLNQKCYLSKTLTYATDMVYFGVHLFTTHIYNMSLSKEMTCGEIQVLSECEMHLLICLKFVEAILT